jgi:hypothetical protein
MPMISVSLRWLACAAATLAIVIGLAAGPAHAAEVHFGRNVHVGGHDFSNQTFDSKHRARIYLYDHTPKHEGCVWRADGHGGRVKICDLRNRNRG